MKGHPAPEGQPVEQLVVAKDRGRRPEVLSHWYRQRWSTPATAEQMLEAPGPDRALFRECQGVMNWGRVVRNFDIVGLES